jgi:hypothetical protein
MAVPRRRASKGRTKKTERVGLGGGSVDEHLSRPRKRSQNKWVQVGDGNTVTVRAVDTTEFFESAYVHPVQFERKDGSTYSMDVLCLDQKEEGTPCPGCRDDLDRRFKFWMLVIQRDAPKTNKQGKEIGEEDQLRILSGANRLVKALNAKHKRRDLAKRDVEISQDGEGFEVSYEVEWATDEDEPLTRADKKLLDNDEITEAFERYTTAPDFDSFYEPPGSDSDDDDDDEDVGARSVKRGSMFDKKRKKGSSKRSRDEDDDDDDDDDEDDKPVLARRRRSSSKSSSKPATKKSPLAKKKGSSSSGPKIKRRR